MHQHILFALRLIWKSSKKWTILLVVFQVLQAIVPLIQLYLIKLIVDIFFITGPYSSPYDDEFEMYEEPDKMTYTEQANKRSHCQRLTRFFSV